MRTLAPCAFRFPPRAPVASLALVVFGALNAFGPRLDSCRRAGDRADIDWRRLRARQTPLERLITTLRDDGDVERYFAYAEAALGRPYAADFVRPAGRRRARRAARPEPDRDAWRARSSRGAISPSNTRPA